MNVVSCQLYAPAAFTHQGRFLVLISVIGRVDPKVILRPEGQSQLKIKTPSEIEPETFGLVEQCLNQRRYRLLQFYFSIRN